MTKDGATTNYTYNELNQLTSSKENKNGNKTSQNFVGTKENVMGTTRYNKDGFKCYTYNKDVQGSTTSVVGQDGTSPVAYDYDDFGVTRSIGDSTFFNEICYTGAIYDVSTGLYYLNARYYDPKNGRFITRDTYRGEINEPDTQHLYAYCANNPINYTDPSGHRSIRNSILDVMVALQAAYNFVFLSLVPAMLVAAWMGLYTLGIGFAAGVIFAIFGICTLIIPKEKSTSRRSNIRVVKYMKRSNKSRYLIRKSIARRRFRIRRA